ncbi:hypothetical protein U0070_005589, partial [Myodes glareolus]
MTGGATLHRGQPIAQHASQLGTADTTFRLHPCINTSRRDGISVACYFADEDAEAQWPMVP